MPTIIDHQAVDKMLGAALARSDRIRYLRLVHEASGLVSEDGDNPEYDRGICELIARLLPVQADTPELAMAVARYIGVKNWQKMYQKAGE